MNFYYPWIDPRVKRVRSEDLIAYLRKHGWPQEESDLDHFIRYRHPVKKAAVYVPTLEEADDSPLRILEAVTQLAKIEERYAGAVLDDLLAPKAQDHEVIVPEKIDSPSHSPAEH
jgi:hypothetical protein